MFFSSRNSIGTVVCIIIAACGAGRVRAGDAADFSKLLDDKSQALVTIKFVLKVKTPAFMGGGDQESENEVTGVMIDPKGLILCSNSKLLGFTAMMGRMMGSMAGGMTATPTDLKVLIGEDVEGLEAELLARDSELDLAWVKIKEPGDRKFTFVDFSQGAKAEVGQRIVAVRLMGKFFARSKVIVEDRIGGITSKPRNLYVPSGMITAAMGLPVYLPDGRVVGLSITQAPEEDETDSNPMAMMSRVSSMQESMMAVILPAADVATATRRALESVEAE